MLTTDGYLTQISGIILVVPAVAAAAWIVRLGRDGTWTTFALAALAHVMLVVALTIFPIPIAGQDYYRQTRGLSEDNGVPFATISGQLSHLSPDNIRQLAGNMLALAPLGVYGPELWPALRDWRRFALVAVAAGVAVELTQLAGSLIEGFTYRVTDVDDAIMNATGAMLVFGAWRWTRGRGIAATRVGAP